MPLNEKKNYEFWSKKAEFCLKSENFAFLINVYYINIEKNIIILICRYIYIYNILWIKQKVIYLVLITY